MLYAEKNLEGFTEMRRRGGVDWKMERVYSYNPGAHTGHLLCLSYVLACFVVLLFNRAPSYVSLVFVAMCSVFWLFWLSYQYLPSDWLERLLWGSLIVVRGSSPESPSRRVRMIFLVYCIASLFYYTSVLSPGPTWYIFLLLWHDLACLCWKCR